MAGDLLAEAVGALLVAGAGVFAGGLVRGATGFGGALVMVPVLAAVFTPAASVALVLLIEAAGYADLLRHAGPRIQWRQITPLTAASVLAVPVGVYIVTRVPPDLMARVIGAAIVVLAAAMLSGWRYAAAPGWPATLGVGVVSGVLDGVAGTPGPPVALFLYGGPQAAQTVRDNLVGYFLVLDLATVAAFAIEGTLRIQLLWLALAFLPVSILANGLGVRLARRLPEPLVRRAALGLVVLLGVVLLLK